MFYNFYSLTNSSFPDTLNVNIRGYGKKKIINYVLQNSHNNQLQNQQQFNTSSEALPPPPDYLLRSQQAAAAAQHQNALQHHNAQQQHNYHHNHHQEHNANAKTHYMTSSTSVGQISSSLSSQNVRTVNDLRNAPNSPGVMRRQLSLSNHHPSSNHSQSSHVINVPFFCFFFFTFYFQPVPFIIFILKFVLIFFNNTIQSIDITDLVSMLHAYFLYFNFFKKNCISIITWLIRLILIICEEKIKF